MDKIVRLELETLKTRALKCMANAYAPYSKFCVGAAIQVVTGEVVTGCNIENVSFGLTMCAERVAVGAAKALDFSQFSALVLVSDSHDPIVPCGACRQVLAEFNPSLQIFSFTISGGSARFCLADLLPLPRQGILDVPRGMP